MNSTFAPFVESRITQGIILRDLPSFGYAGVGTRFYGQDREHGYLNGLVVGKPVVKITNLRSKPGYFSVRFTGKGKYHGTIHLNASATIIIEGRTLTIGHFYRIATGK